MGCRRGIASTLPTGHGRYKNDHVAVLQCDVPRSELVVYDDP
jgi:hypothetical protein